MVIKNKFQFEAKLFEQIKSSIPTNRARFNISVELQCHRKWQRISHFNKHSISGPSKETKIKYFSETETNCFEKIKKFSLLILKNKAQIIVNMRLKLLTPEEGWIWVFMGFAIRLNLIIAVILSCSCGIVYWPFFFTLPI